MFKKFSSEPVHDPINKQASATEVKKTTCYMCACRCGIRAHLRDGKLVYIDGNPEHPLNQGVICAKGSSGIMKQNSPARITQPLLRKEGSERGNGEFEAISWDKAFNILSERLAKIRATDPKKFALFTGRDQMQALTGLFARQFGTPNYAAHGGFCSVNMAAGMIYTIGGSFWEFGGPDLDQAKLFVMIGTAEDHHSNPMKIALSKFKRAGGRFISINPVRTGYSAIADEWIPIKPGTDGALFMALMHELIRQEKYDAPFLKRFSNSAQLVCMDSGLEEGLFLYDPDSDPLNLDLPHNKYIWDEKSQTAKPCFAQGTSPALSGEYIMGSGPHQGKKVVPAFELLKRQVSETTPEWAAAITSIPADRIRKLALEMADTAFGQEFELPIQWTDTWGETHQSVTGRPVAFHAMRGLSAHSNGFQTTRGLAVLMSLLGTIDRPGGFRHKPPYPRQVPPNAKPPSSENDIKPNTPLAKPPLGWPTQPEDLALDSDGKPLRIDKAYSWEHPLAAHGLMHNVITNAVKGDPYSIDTLMIFMANMSWNSTMNTMEVREHLNAKNEDGEFKIPFLVVCDAFQSEMVDFADLVLPDTTYLERHDVMSMLDRPISEFDGPVDSVRIPVLEPLGECKPFQEVLIELASRLKFPAFTTPEGERKFKDYPDFITRFQTAPDSGIGFLTGWRGKDGDKPLRGEPNPNQWQKYAENNCVHQYHMPPEHQYMRNWNKGYLEFSKENALRQKSDPIMIAIYSDVLQRFRLASTGKRPGAQPPEHLKARIYKYFDPLPFWYPPLEDEATDLTKFTLNAITQRPMAMYHSWDSQNAWLRQIHSHNYLYVNTATALKNGIADGAWMWIESQWGKVRCMARHSEAVDPGTVWTWNAIGKAESAWSLTSDADESKKGFLLNHLISEELPLGGFTVSNSDPITGQAGWYDVRVRLAPADENEPKETWPQVKAFEVPGMTLKKTGVTK
ncbi:molybdopterin oxidoreductase family protein [Polynucleobacter sp. MWH-Braz-FAM2G]|uniref:molybdopterin oxidoreductase family protein n=1 Tax=Polynucleobacter sp. MWH-Braz-FAM2G TaxID=1855883 RepID=UPI001BFEC73D|nr:molybdopterin oxidoreductase family protein [Polynucleobacter sp. MWH-Braz-FAM2G]QWD91254.1 molybdopterin oxidoreductase family protein [Polynucleobacter sp. MWH-Braz-FAM2G]